MDVRPQPGGSAHPRPGQRQKHIQRKIDKGNKREVVDAERGRDIRYRNGKRFVRSLQYAVEERRRLK